MPTAYTILFVLIALVALATWFIPAGAYDYADGVPQAGTYHPVDPSPQGLAPRSGPPSPDFTTPWMCASSS